MSRIKIWFHYKWEMATTNSSITVNNKLKYLMSVISQARTSTLKRTLIKSPIPKSQQTSSATAKRHTAKARFSKEFFPNSTSTLTHKIGRIAKINDNRWPIASASTVHHLNSEHNTFKYRDTHSKILVNINLRYVNIFTWFVDNLII